jgi:protein SCO1/2
MRRFIAVLCCAALAACASHAQPLHGTELSPAKPAARFTLTDQRGATYTLGENRGQAIALYFGFSHCKDVCPQTLALLGKARTQAHLTPEKLRIVMVTVDPARDTPPALAAFVKRVGVQATALTGTRSQLQSVYKAYGVDVEPQKNDIGHTDMIYIIDANGRLREVFGPDMPLHAVADDLRAIVD